MILFGARLAQLDDELLDEAIVDDIALRGLQETLLLPHIIHDMITPDAQGECFIRQPEERHNDVRLGRWQVRGGNGRDSQQP